MEFLIGEIVEWSGFHIVNNDSLAPIFFGLECCQVGTASIESLCLIPGKVLTLSLPSQRDGTLYFERLLGYAVLVVPNGVIPSGKAMGLM